MLALTGKASITNARRRVHIYIQQKSQLHLNCCCAGQHPRQAEQCQGHQKDTANKRRKKGGSAERFPSKTRQEERSRVTNMLVVGRSNRNMPGVLRWRRAAVSSRQVSYKTHSIPPIAAEVVGLPMAHVRESSYQCT